MLGCVLVSDMSTSEPRLRPGARGRLGRNLPGDEFTGCQPGKLAEVVNEVRLIVVAARVRDFGPARSVGTAQLLHRVIESHDARVRPRRDADLFTKSRDQVPLAALEVARQPGDAGAAPRVSQHPR